MSRKAQAWSVRLAHAVEQDFLDIYLWTADKFGIAQAEIYAAKLSFTIDALRAGPLAIGVRKRGDVSKGLRSLPVKIKRGAGRHQVYFRVVDHAREILVLRILHDAMDPSRHIPQ